MDTYRFTITDNREEGMEEPIQDVDGTISRGISVGSRDEVDGYVHWLQAGDDSPVGGIATYF